MCIQSVILTITFFFRQFQNVKKNFDFSTEYSFHKGLESLAVLMWIDIGERIAGKQDGPSLIIEGPPSPPPPRIAKKIIFFTLGPIYEQLGYAHHPFQISSNKIYLVPITFLICMLN